MGFVYDNTGKLQDQEYLLRKAEYLRYITNHVNNVRKGFDILFGSKKYNSFPKGISQKDWNDSVTILSMIVNKHDESKYTEEEFEPYRRHFYPTKLEKEEDEDSQTKAEQLYEAAWEHHYRNNDHHPEYWKYIRLIQTEDGNYDLQTVNEPSEVGVPMPLVCVMHMFCDWFAMDTFHNSTNHAAWYKSESSKEERTCLNPETKELIKDMFTMLYGEDVSSVE
jgi:hypothetical protein